MVRRKTNVFKIHIDKGYLYIKKDGYAWKPHRMDRFYTRKSSAKRVYDKIKEREGNGPMIKVNINSNLDSDIYRLVKTDRGWTVIELSTYITKKLGLRPEKREFRQFM